MHFNLGSRFGARDQCLSSQGPDHSALSLKDFSEASVHLLSHLTPMDKQFLSQCFSMGTERKVIPEKDVTPKPIRVWQVGLASFWRCNIPFAHYSISSLLKAIFFFFNSVILTSSPQVNKLPGAYQWHQVT